MKNEAPSESYEDEYTSEFSRPSTSLFSWPPPPEDDHDAPTASPLYRPPPETQHVHPKTINGPPLPSSANTIIPNPLQKPTMAQQSRSAPELTAINLKEHNDASAESCSDSYTSTCTTTTTTSEEYQRMYQAQQYSSNYAQSTSDMDCSVDAEMAAYPYGSFSSGTTDLMSFSGRRSVQECAESLSNVVDTSQLVKYLKDLTPAPISPLSFPKPTKKVEFALIPHSPVPPVLPIGESSIPNHPPKEWKSSMVRALTTASGETFHIADVPPITDYDSYDSPYNQCAHPCQAPCNVDCGQIKASWEQPPCEKQCALEQEVSDINDNHTNYYENQLPAFEPPCFRKVVSPYPDQLKTHKVQYSTNVAQPQFLQDQPPQGSDLANLLTTASPNPVNWTVLSDDEPPITLPPEQPAFVPTPISMKPYEKEDYTKKSPLLNALVTAPFRSFTPFDHDVITQLEDLPTPKQELRLIDALTVASPTPFHHNLPRELPSVTETERIQKEKEERAAIMGQHVNEIINHTIESQVERRGSAFAQVSGFRSVHPFHPMPKAISKQEEQIVSNPTPPQITNSQQVVRPPSKIPTPRTPQPVVSFPPPLGVPNAHFVQSGLHEPATIPKYQRQWFNLASQSPVRTPEPHELKENVPLAFVELSNTQHQQQEQQHQLNYTTSEVRQALAAVNVSVSDHSNEPQQTSQPNQSYHLQSTDPSQHQQRTRTASPASRPYTPSLINKPAPTIPYYQQNLVAEECDAPNSHLFLDPRIDSPMPDRCPSPAPGPPPNPLRIHAPRTHSPPSQVSSFQTSSSSNLTAPIHLHGGATLLAQQQAQHSSGSRSFHDKPEVVQQSQVGNTTIQSRSKQSQLNEEQRSNFESASTTQIGNTQVQRKTRVVEEFEHSQKASTVEVYKSTGNSHSLPRSIQSGGSGAQNFASYKNQPKVTAAELQSVQTNQQDGFSCFKSSLSNQQQNEPRPEPVGTARGAPMGFVAREARRLSANSQYKVDLATYESRFPQTAAPTPTSQFPLKNFKPIAEEPKAQTYNVNKKQINKPPPGYQQIQPDLKFTTRSSLAQPPPNPKLIQTTTNQRVKTKQITQQQQQQQQQFNQPQPPKVPQTTNSPPQAPHTSFPPPNPVHTPHTTFPPPFLPAQAPHTSFPPPQPIVAYQPPQTPVAAPSSLSSSAYSSNYNQSSAKSAFQSTTASVPQSLPSSAFVPPKPHAPTQPPSVVIVSDPNPASAGPAGAGGVGNNNAGGGKALKFGATSAPKRGRGVLNQAGSSGGRIPQCGCCSAQIR